MSKQRRYTVGTWNMKVGRNQKVVRDYLIWLLTAHRIKVLLLQEAGGYERLLDRIPGYTCVQFDHRPDSDNLAILVSNDYVARWSWLRTMRKRWWGAKNDQWRSARSVLSLRAGGVRWINWHRVAYQNHQVNVSANREIDRKMVRWVRRVLPRRIVIGGDANDGKRTPEMQSFADATGLQAKGSGIDFFFFGGDGLELRHVRTVDKPSGSDHHPKTAEVVIG